MRNEKRRTRKHFYDLDKEQDRRQTEAVLRSVDELAFDAEDVWWEHGYWNILFQQFRLKFRYRKTGRILYIELKTCTTPRRGV